MESGQRRSEFPHRVRKLLIPKRQGEFPCPARSGSSPAHRADSAESGRRRPSTAGTGWPARPGTSPAWTVSWHGTATRCSRCAWTSPAAETVAAARERFGRLDVVINNAGHGLFGPVEDVTEEQERAQFDTNFFGALWVTQAVRPVLREQGSRHILQMSSIAGTASWPMLGLYHASKWALEGMTDALAQEVARFGIHVTLLEPGPFRTDWRGSSAV
ncbi:SDR family NAD(P)-dependent oxidoreductase [Streptomyces sp. NPDC059278]|uniref:SDR family NAD(P)-dependent oxidoreductase n=1 Tax=Streptomyces sp. NPDC059278 TaxID=3346801 RepID=UPI00368BF1D0